MIIDKETLSEYKKSLSNLKKEYDELQDVEKEVTKRRDEIKARIKDIAKTVTNDKNIRAVLPAYPYGAWDRSISMLNSGISIQKLKEILGESEFQRLCCIREEVFTPSEEMIALSRRTKEITDEVYAAAYYEGDPSHVLKTMDRKQFEKYETGEIKKGVLQ